MKQYVLTTTVSAIFLLLAALNCNMNQKNDKYNFPYRLNEAKITHTLADVLHEISGISLTDDTHIACINDEMGTVFMYDMTTKSIAQQFKFSEAGDYEDITRVENTFYVLRSDGVISEIIDYASEKRIVNTYVTNIPAKNNEGLCYDKDNNRLLIACKSKSGSEKNAKEYRAVWGFDLSQKKLSKVPVFSFNLNEIRKFAANKNIKPSSKDTKNNSEDEKEIKMKSSAIAIHPIDKDIYILSASEFLLFVFNKDGRIKHIEQLDNKIFKKAEGITFFPNGNMLISNEGAEEKPTVLLFTYN